MLVVDDTEDLRESFSQVLEGEGYRVLTAVNGQHALDVLHSLTANPSLVFLDMVMPILDGEQFLRALRSTRRFDTLPVVVVSGTLASTELDGAQRAVRKPVSADVLIRLAHEFCGSPLGNTPAQS